MDQHLVVVIHPPYSTHVYYRRIDTINKAHTIVCHTVADALYAGLGKLTNPAVERILRTGKSKWYTIIASSSVPITITTHHELFI